ncbi:trypsin-like peptidase domain-containing protein [Bradyrhizobium sp. C-145]|uniref:trypsin-like peptidase domain-containing protein n=1 Tax=Bradyrhizobium sp. C-145 TaxID=574727 RepID=UPI00201B77B4|nr:trypsin-like peptidase domain-containing protein [Bradyrhizobium sp. C-145]UQR62149.1 trypsin-like peptidase domain-containing protein [Bradyrhizobium sp. C-145]
MNAVRLLSLALLVLALTASQPAAGQIPDLKTGGSVPTLAPLVRQVTPAVVNISVHGRVREDNPLYRDPLFREFFDVPRQIEKEVNATGSGVIVDAQRGYVLTNNHVVEGTTSAVQITTQDGRQFSAKVIGRDPPTDVAVLQIQNPAGLKALSFGDSDALEVGDFVLAIGNQSPRRSVLLAYQISIISQIGAHDGLQPRLRAQAGNGEFHGRLPLVGRQANFVRPYLSRSDLPRGRHSDEQGSDHRHCNAGLRARERSCAGARGRCSARRLIRCGRAGPGRSRRGSFGRLHRRTFDRSILGHERFAVGKAPPAAASRGRDPRPTARARGDGCQRPDESCRQSDAAGSSRARRAAANLDAARSGIRLRPIDSPRNQRGLANDHGEACVLI